MDQTEAPNRTKARMARHRTKTVASGSKRIEVTVPSRDTGLVKAIASALRAGGKDAQHIRESLEPIVSLSKAKTGSELVAFFRNAPLIGDELDIERDTSTGRSADFS